MAKGINFFYLQIAQMLEVGMSLPHALDRCKSRAPVAIKEKLHRACIFLDNGEIPWKAFAQARFNKLTVALLQAAEKTGDLPGCFRKLAEQAERMERLKRKMMVGLAYPVLLIVITPLILNAKLLFFSGAGAYISSILAMYVPIIVVVVAAVILHKILIKTTPYNQILNHIPYIKSLRLRSALVRFCGSATALFEAGIRVEDCLRLAGESTNNVIYAAQVEAVLPDIAAGRGISEALDRVAWLPPVVKDFVHSGEYSGKLPESFGRLENLYTEELEAQLAMLAKIVPVLVYCAVAAFIAYKIVSFYSGFYKNIGI